MFININIGDFANAFIDKDEDAMAKIKKITDYTGNHDDIIKRVIALPGETISCENNKIYINCRKIEDKYGSGITSDFKKIKLKNNEYFVLGDNRENSMDSRYYGPFNKKNIKGSTNIIVFPFNKIGKVE